jgi:hypothetical protein
MAGARMLSNYPTSIVVHGVALNITVQSYADHMDFGLMADAQAMPDVRLLADALRVAFDDLCLLDAEVAADEPTLADTGMAVVKQARKRLVDGIEHVSGSVGNTVGQVVTGAVKGAVSGALRGSLKRTLDGMVSGALGQAKATVPRSTGLKPVGRNPGTADSRSSDAKTVVPAKPKAPRQRKSAP